MECIAGVCGAQGAVAAACGAAVDLGVLPDGVPVERTGSTGAGFGNFEVAMDSTTCVAFPT